MKRIKNIRKFTAISQHWRNSKIQTRGQLSEFLKDFCQDSLRICKNKKHILRVRLAIRQVRLLSLKDRSRRSEVLNKNLDPRMSVIELKQIVLGISLANSHKSKLKLRKNCKIFKRMLTNIILLFRSQIKVCLTLKIL